MCIFEFSIKLICCFNKSELKHKERSKTHSKTANTDHINQNHIIDIIPIPKTPYEKVGEHLAKSI